MGVANKTLLGYTPRLSLPTMRYRWKRWLFALFVAFLFFLVVHIHIRSESNVLIPRSTTIGRLQTEIGLSDLVSDETTLVLNANNYTTSGRELNVTNTTLVPTVQYNDSSPLLPHSMWFPSTGHWSKDFCKSFLEVTYDRLDVVCTSRITCLGNKHSKKMGTCILNRVGVRPSLLHKAMTTLKVENILKSKSVWLIPNHFCQNSHFRNIEKYMEIFDPILPIVKMSSIIRSDEECNVWLRGTTFFYVGMSKHIYFKFLGWYNLFKSIRSNGNQHMNINIIRLPEPEGEFLFTELERRLFGNVIPLQNLSNLGVVCFESLVLVSWAYGAPMFRCKMDGSALRKKCLQCDGTGLDTDLVAFRQHVLAGCSIEDPPLTGDRKTKIITVIQRKRYERFKGDPLKKFKRVWTNSDQLIEKIKRTFPTVQVRGIYAELLPICEQIRLIHETDVLVAMHGAGMVHLWWQQSHGKVLELVPKSQRGNAAFITLSKLLGRTHKALNKVTEKGQNVQVDINKAIQELKMLVKI